LFLKINRGSCLARLRNTFLNIAIIFGRPNLAVTRFRIENCKKDDAHKKPNAAGEYLLQKLIHKFVQKIKSEKTIILSVMVTR